MEQVCSVSTQMKLLTCFNCGPQFHRLLSKSASHEVWACPTCEAKWGLLTEYGKFQGMLHARVANCHSKIFNEKFKHLKKKGKNITMTFKDGSHFTINFQSASYFIKTPILKRILTELLGFNEYGSLH